MGTGLKIFIRRLISWRFGALLILLFLASQGLFGYVLESRNSSEEEQKEQHIQAFKQKEDIREKTVPTQKTLKVQNKVDLNNSEVTQSLISSQGINFNCSIDDKVPISAIKRAKSQKCKQEIAEFVCKLQESNLYPKRLQNSCPKDQERKNEYLGCFQDSRDMRLLTSEAVRLTKNSPPLCVDFCVQTGHSFAGVEYGSECFCGDIEPSPDVRRNSSMCNMTCPGRNASTCGGYLMLEMYATGISPKRAAITELPTVTTGGVKIAFILSLNGRAARQVRRLLRAIYRPKHFYFIHVDSRQDFLFREMLRLESQFSNIKVARKRLSTIWGGASLLKMLMKSFSDISATEWDFVLNLSESDYPVKSIESLEAFLGANVGKNFVKSHGRNTAEFIKKQGLDRTFYECERHMWRLGNRNLPKGVKFDGGSDWVVLHRDFVNFLLNGNSDLVKGLEVVYNYTLLPAESFFHVVLLNSKFCSTYVDSNLRLTHWKRSQGCQCQYKHVVDWCGCSPMVFRMEDHRKIENLEERQIYFARKFEGFVSQSAITKLEEKVVGPWTNGTSLNSYWENAYHHQDLSPEVSSSFLSLAQVAAETSALLLSLDGQCSILVSFVTEVTHYFSDDEYQGSLVMFEVATNEVFEVRIQPIRKFVKKGSYNNLSSRLISLRVGADYDVKEQVFRNPALPVGPFSELYVEHSWGRGQAGMNATFYWLDPKGGVAAQDVVSVDIDQTVSWTKPKFHEALIPGIWTVLAVVEEELAGHLDFPVFPLLKSPRLPLMRQKPDIKEGSPKIVQDFVATRAPFLESTDAKLIASTLFKRYYAIQDACIVLPNGNSDRDCTGKFVSCKSTRWSSVSPDPKAEFGPRST